MSEFTALESEEEKLRYVCAYLVVKKYLSLMSWVSRSSEKRKERNPAFAFFLDRRYEV